MEHLHTGGLIGLVSVIVIELFKLARKLVDKRARQPLVRQSEIDRRENTRELKALRDEVSYLRGGLARLEGWKEGTTSEFKIPTRKL